MNTIKVRYTDLKRWVASQLIGLAMTIYNDDDQPDDNLLKYAAMENVYIQSFDDWRNSESTIEGLTEIAKELDEMLQESDALYIEELQSLKAANLREPVRDIDGLVFYTREPIKDENANDS